MKCKGGQLSARSLVSVSLLSRCLPIVSPLTGLLAHSCVPLLRCNLYVMDIRRAGDNALLIELGGSVSAEEVRAAAVAAKRLTGVESCIVGHASLYLTFSTLVPELEESELLTNVQELERAPARRHDIPVSFAEADAPDLSQLLLAAELTHSEFLSIIDSLVLRARYLGFRPGFAYLEGIPDRWQMPRLEASRAEVKQGSFGIAGPMAAFYPLRGPGGWNLIGRTNVSLWDEGRMPPNLISPGDDIRLVPSILRFEEEAPPGRRIVFEGPQVAEVIFAGQLTLLVGASDSVRTHTGLPAGGPFDQQAATAANRALGNGSDASVMECIFVGPELRFVSDALLSWFGANAHVAVDDAPLIEPRQFAVRAGQTLSIGRLFKGARGYLAIQGGWVPSASPFALHPGRVSRSAPLHRGATFNPAARITTLLRDEAQIIGVAAGPHDVGEQRLRALLERPWRVDAASDRVGIRFKASGLSGPPGDMPSSGMQFGTVQWHPSGELVAMGPDHPTTGGYLQAMTVLKGERWKLAQLSPGDEVRWVAGVRGEGRDER